MTTFVTSILAFTLSILLAAVDLSGVWTLSWQPDFGGNDNAYDCTLKQAGQTLTLTCGDNPPIAGEVDGEKITLRFKTGRGQQRDCNADRQSRSARNHDNRLLAPDRTEPKRQIRRDKAVAALADPNRCNWSGEKNHDAAWRWRERG
jgi:hypothetical protein